MAPDLVFAEAHLAGSGHDLETLALAKAIEAGAARPENTVLSLNVSPSTLLTRQFMSVLPEDLTGLQIEITEHEKITDKDQVLSVLRRSCDVAAPRSPSTTSARATRACSS